MKSRTVGLSILGAAIALFDSGIVSARQAGTPAAQTPPPLVIQVGLDLIQIDASVTDKRGRPVGDLRPEDFTLKVDGRELPITDAAWFGPSSPRIAGEGDLGSETDLPTNSDSTVVFVIDDLNISFGSMYKTRAALALFASEMDATRPLVGLRVSSNEDERLSLHRSSDRLARTASALRYNIRSSKGISSTRAVNTSSFYPSQNPASSSVDASLAGSLTPTEERQNLDQRAFSLVSTINSLRGVPGRKAVVFVSEGFYLDNRTSSELDMGFPFSSLFDDTNVRAALRMITEVANRASVVLYTVNPRGLTVDFPGVGDNITAAEASALTASRRSERLGSQESLQYLADVTGGLAVANRNDLKRGFGDVMRDQGAYYLLGFEPPESTFVMSSGRPKFHKIKLSVNRKDVRVRTRAGFYGVTDEDVRKRAPVTPLPTTP